MAHVALVRAVVGVTLTCLAAAAHGEESLREKIDTWAKAFITDDGAVGFVVGVIENGRTHVLPYGETKRGSGVMPTGDTVYEIGSVTKVFTGVLLAQMVETGEVALDDPVQKYLPAEVTMPKFGEQPITLLHLATHSSGLPRLPGNLRPADRTDPYADYGPAKLYAFLNEHKLRRAPGQTEYSNLGMGLLGHALARRAGMSYEKLVAERITGPLKMTDTQITLNDDLRTRLAPPYNMDLEPDHNWHIEVLGGAGAIRSTVKDMLKFAAANLAADDATPLGRALTRSRQKHHHTPGAPVMGLAWHRAADGATWWHNGMTGGYHAWLAVAPERGVATVVLANTANMRVTALGEEVMRMALGAPLRPPPKPRPSAAVEPAVLEKYAGVYQLAPLFLLAVTLEDGKLMVQATGQQKLRVYAESPTVFYYKVVDAKITFTPAADGRTASLTLHQNGRDMPGHRVE